MQLDNIIVPAERTVPAFKPENTQEPPMRANLMPENTQEPPMRERTTLPQAPSRKRNTPTPGTDGSAGDEDGEVGLPASKVLLLCCGSNTATHSLHEYFAKEGVVCDGYDVSNGPHNDPADTYVFERMHRDVRAGEYAAAYACPDTSLFAKLRSTTGPQRYGNLAELTKVEKDLVRLQNIICTRVAKILDEMTRMNLPWICQTVATTDYR
jgi:hypothetical protein